MFHTNAYAALNNHDDLEPHIIQRRDVLADDVKIAIRYCGICHTDIHIAHNDWGRSVYPVVPGHEIVGQVEQVGSNVHRFKKGDWVGVGCMVDSCQSCSSCKKDLQQFCENGVTMTYGSPDPHFPGQPTHGGYSKEVVVNENFVLKVSKKLDLKAVAPLLCAGITMYSPLRHWQAGPNQSVAIVGLGGLGHMGVKLGAAMGAEITVITSSQEKARDAKRLGAHNVLLSNNSEEMAKSVNRFDLIINTVPVAHDINQYMPLLKNEKTMVLVGSTPVDLHSSQLIFGRKNIAGSLIGGINETQEMLDFCAEHNIVSDVEMIDIQSVNDAYKRIMDADVKYRFVIDLSSLK